MFKLSARASLDDLERWPQDIKHLARACGIKLFHMQTSKSRRPSKLSSCENWCCKLPIVIVAGETTNRIRVSLVARYVSLD